MLKKYCSGFTLVELLIVIVIAGVLVVIGLPSFREFIERNKVRSSAESVLNALQLARAEAVNRNEQITFSLGTGSGATSWKVTNSDGNDIQVSRSSGEGSASVTASVDPVTATELVFNGFGRVVGNSGISTIVFGSVNTSLTVQVEIQHPGGQIRMCDPSVSAAGDPRKCLQ